MSLSKVILAHEVIHFELEPQCVLGFSWESGESWKMDGNGASWNRWNLRKLKFEWYLN